MSSSVLDRAKNAILEKALLLFLRPKLSRYGEIDRLTLDASAKLLSAEIRLRGDPAPLVISEARYRIERVGDESRLILHSVKASREWVENLLQDYLEKIPLRIPEVVSRLLD